MARFTRVATPEERLDLILLTALTSSDADELAHIAEHVGMGEMPMLRGVAPNAIREFFGRLNVNRQLVVLRELEACEW